LQRDRIRELLEAVARKECPVEEALARLTHWPVEDLGFAQIDHHRQMRRGFPEVVFAGGKEPSDTVRIAVSLVERGSSLLVTRASSETLTLLQSRLPEGRVNARGRTFSLAAPLAGKTGEDPGGREDEIVILSAGTSDIPVAEEALETVLAMGAKAKTIYDVGVAGLSRLVPHLETLRRAEAIIAVAGMEGALPSVIGSLAACPVIAVPTSVGYGTSLGGFTALLGMLNSCASGVLVVNIDNGFGAGFAAGLIHRTIRERAEAGGAGR